VRAQVLNAASQRVFISVRDLGADAAPSAEAMLPARFGVDTRIDESHGDQDSGFAVCDLLAQRMRGDLRINSEPGFGTCTIFSAPFSIEPPSLSTETSEPAHSMTIFATGQRQYSRHTIRHTFHLNLLNAAIWMR